MSYMCTEADCVNSTFFFKENYFSYDKFIIPHAYLLIHHAIPHNANHKKNTILFPVPFLKNKSTWTSKTMVCARYKVWRHLVLDLSPNCCSITASAQIVIEPLSHVENLVFVLAQPQVFYNRFWHALVAVRCVLCVCVSAYICSKLLPLSILRLKF